ncbi:MAG: hypothetical protein R2822_26940 [Spirosomataceae bacterium]
MATKLFDRQQFEDVADFEPYYLKDFMATTPKKEPKEKKHYFW